MNENKINYHNYQMQNNDLKQNYSVQEQFPRNDYFKDEINYIQPLNHQICEREEKKYKQEDSRKILDQQRQETFDKIDNNEGLVNQEKQISSNQFQGKIVQNDDIKGNEFLKEKEKQKKMEYNQYLKQQIEERKQKREIEKQKEKEEEAKYEQKFQGLNQIEPLINFKKQNAYNQMLTTDEQLRLQQQEQQQQFIQPIQLQCQLQTQQNTNDCIMTQPQQLRQYDINNQTNNYNLKSGYSLHQHPNNLHNTQSGTQIIHTPFQDPYITQTYNQYQSNPYNQYSEPTLINQSHSINAMTYNPQPNYQINMNTQPMQPMTPNYFIPHLQQPIVSYDHLNEIFQKFMAHQMALISEYENKIDYLFSNRISEDYIKTLLTERNSTMDKIKSDQEKLRSRIGYYPMQNEYNNKISNLLNLILEKKIDKIQSLTINRTSRVQSAKPSNYNNTYQNNNEVDIPKNRTDESLAIQSKIFDSTKQKKQPLVTSQVYRDLLKCNYRSKYEDLKQSIMNFEDASPQLKESLAGNSKLVKPTHNNINNSNSQNLFQTWRSEWKQDLNDKNMSKLESIKEEMNDQNKLLYNVSQANILMTNSNNTMTEKSHNNSLKESPQNLINKDNNVSHKTKVFKSMNRRNENICNRKH